VILNKNRARLMERKILIGKTAKYQTQILALNVIIARE
jgi:hypothetical protein